MIEAKRSIDIPQDVPNDAAVFFQQHQWIKEGGIGCVFSQILATRKERGSTRWTNLIERSTPEQLMRTANGDKFMEAVRTSVSEGQDELFSAIFPNITTPENIAGLVAYLGKQQPFHIEEITTGKIRADNPNLYNGIYLRLALPNGADSWPLTLGPYEFFSPSRRAPFTQLVFRPIPIKNNPTTPEDQVGVDDTVLPFKPRTFQQLLTRTVHNVAETRGDYNQNLFRARVAAIVPQQEWEHAQSRLGIRY